MNLEFEEEGGPENINLEFRGIQMVFESMILDLGMRTDLVSADLRASTSLVAQTVKNLPAVRETHVGSLGWEDPLEKEMATHSSVLA